MSASHNTGGDIEHQAQCRAASEHGDPCVLQAGHQHAHIWRTPDPGPEYVRLRQQLEGAVARGNLAAELLALGFDPQDAIDILEGRMTVEQARDHLGGR